MRIISADSHINEPPRAWHYVPNRLRDRVPKLAPAPSGGEGWSYHGRPPATSFGIEALAGRPLDGKIGDLTFDEILPGNYDGAAHVADMELDGVDVSVVYPNYAIWVYVEEDQELAAACLRSYNDWILQDFQAASPDHIVGLPLLPTDDIDATIAELDRTIAMGARAAFIPASPQVPYHVESYDRLWAAVVERDITLTFHRTNGGKPWEVNWDELDGRLTSAAGTTVRFFAGVRPFTYLVFSGVFDRFPNLRIVGGELNCGWIPFWSQTCDQQFDNKWYRGAGQIHVERKPSEYVGTNIFVTTLDDPVGFDLMATGRYPEMVDAVMFSSDYPHSVCLWPDSRKWAAELTEGLDAGSREKILSATAARLYKV
jgi:predicted TIM-barrel fold metal-dependent hydrolase